MVQNEKLWGAAASTFLVGDVVTTHIGMEKFGAVEAHPLAESVLGMSGTSGMVAVKLGVMGAAYMSTKLAPEEHREMAPIMLAVLGLGITAHNINVISQLD